MSRKIFAILLALVFVLPIPLCASAVEVASPTITMDDIYSEETVVIYVSDETAFYPDPSTATPMTYGTYPIYTRVITTKSSSSGIILRDSVLGTYASIAGTALSFISGILPMTVSAIISATQLYVSSSDYVQVETYTSYIRYVRRGEARWADESTYTPWIYSGKEETYKHVLSAKKLSTGLWSTETKDYTDEPALIKVGMNYGQPDSWFKQQAYERCIIMDLYDEMPW